MRRGNGALAPGSCGMHREVPIEVLTGETDRPAIELRNHNSRMPTLLSEAEGHGTAAPCHTVPAGGALLRASQAGGGTAGVDGVPWQEYESLL